jgi:hypothetical protein
MATLSGINAFSTDILTKLKRANILSTDAMVLRCATPENRRFIMSVTGVSDETLHELALACELFRLKRVGVQSFELLYAIGIRRLTDIAESSAEDILTRINALPAETRVGRQIPRLETFQDWIENARSLKPRIV